jgi:hypothetical protein
MDKEQSPWMWNGEPVTPEVIPEWAVGYVYLVEHLSEDNNRIITYVGKKILQTNRKQKIGKRAIAAERANRADGKAKTVKRVIKESDWKSYWGSSKTLHAAKETGKGCWKRTIVAWCYSKKNMSYEECKWQHKMNVMSTPSYNDHIANWYRQDTDINYWLQWKREQQEKRANKKLNNESSTETTE